MTNEQLARDYYASDYFKARQQQIATGELQPRVYIETCRFTTFLKYCAADFRDAFKLLGCTTKFVIEENDVQQLTLALLWKNLCEFAPDVVFMVSFARSVRPYLPRELPFISYMQDKCGPTLVLPDLSDYVTRQDLFAVMYHGLGDYIVNKGIPADQVFTMPVPASEDMFYPLPNKFRYCDVSFVNHGKTDLDKVLQDFLTHDCSQIEPLMTVITEAYKQFCCSGDKRIYEQEVQDYIHAKFTSEIDNETRHCLTVIATAFYVKVYQSGFRSAFLLALDKAGIDLQIYGNGWDKHSQLKHLAQGPASRGLHLNEVYNGSKINLNIHTFLTMHQRVPECGLAGGFMMIADHNKDDDQCNARDYYRDDEVVFFGTTADMIDKCRYYLEHENERLEIAERMYKRSVAERTCKMAAVKLLDEWRKLLVEPVPELHFKKEVAK